MFAKNIILDSFGKSLLSSTSCRSGHHKMKCFNMLLWATAVLSLSVRHSSSMRVAVVGSGNFGSVIARDIARNAKTLNGEIDHQVKMWVFDEKVQGRSLIDIINTDHVNAKYLPGIDLTPQVVASGDLLDVCSAADVLVFVVPHMFLPGSSRLCCSSSSHTVC